MEEEKGSTASNFKTICVFCDIMLKNIDLVYEGGSIGLMGLISQTVFDGGRNVLGVIPEALIWLERYDNKLFHFSPILSDKAEMGSYADAFIVLSGGYGTFEELFEVISWAQLGIHNKPLNVDEYYNSLLSFINKIIISSSNAKELIEKLEEYSPHHK
ncbi:LOG family protein [Dioscorea alata]|uniref:LOG family protein n=1 Tax=Dioscorea alata TaxID=55571 RepID=A0ACB7VAA1_DIOAL|nr:LOG family protein [Dioscorea alata]